MKRINVTVCLFLLLSALIFKGCSGDSKAHQIVQTLNSIRDLYNIDAIKKMNLGDLKWVKDRSSILEDGTLLLEGNFISGTWETISKDDLDNGRIDNTVSLSVTHPVKLYIPPGYPELPNVGYGAMIALQTEKEFNNIDVDHEKIFVKPAIEEGIPVIIHANYDTLWLGRGYNGANELMSASARLMMLRGDATVENMRLLLLYSYIRENLMAITLMQRLLEAEGGHLNKGVIAHGGSKQGFANWLQAMVDDRVKVSVPINIQLQDYIAGTERYITDWGCNEATECTSGFTVEDRLDMRDWILNTETGQIFNNIYDISVQQDLLFPQFFVVSSDVTSPGHHDCQFPLGADSSFLKGLKREWRGFRTIDSTADDDAYWTSKVDPRFEYMWRASIKELINPSDWIKVVDVKTEHITSSELKISAFLENYHNSPKVTLWYASSTNRAWNDLEQVNSWKYRSMVRDNDVWLITVDVPLDKEWAYFVEVEDADESGQTRIDASPVEFFNEFPMEQCTLKRQKRPLVSGRTAP